jgi:hypothetical protein
MINNRESMNANIWNQMKAGTAIPTGLIRYTPIARMNITGTLILILVLIAPAANAPAAVASTVNGPSTAMRGLINNASSEPIITAITPKKGPKRNPMMGAETRPKDISPPPPTLRLNGISVIIRCTAPNIPVRAHGYAIERLNPDIEFSPNSV